MMRSSSQLFHDQIFRNTTIQEAQVKNYPTCCGWPQ